MYECVFVRFMSLTEAQAQALPEEIHVSYHVEGEDRHCLEYVVVANLGALIMCRLVQGISWNSAGYEEEHMCKHDDVESWDRREWRASVGVMVARSPPNSCKRVGRSGVMRMGRVCVEQCWSDVGCWCRLVWRSDVGFFSFFSCSLSFYSLFFSLSVSLARLSLLRLPLHFGVRI